MNLIIALMTKTKENACSQVVRKLRTQNLKPGFRLYDGNKLGCFFLIYKSLIVALRFFIFSFFHLPKIIQTSGRER